jgi:hypothetical protein
MKRLIYFLVRRYLGLKKYERFRFVNQRSENNYYYFGDGCLRKFDVDEHVVLPSHVSLNWLLDDECEIEKIND